jgi:hypothetical protein
MLIGARRAILSSSSGGGPINLLLAAEPPTLIAGDSTWDQPTRTISSPNFNSAFWKWLSVIPGAGNVRFVCTVNLTSGDKIRLEYGDGTILWTSSSMSIGVNSIDSGLIPTIAGHGSDLNLLADTAVLKGIMSAFALTTS